MHSSTTPQGSDGCALWVHLGLEYLPGRTIADSMRRVLHAEPARNIVGIRGHGISINVLVMYAPHSRAHAATQTPEERLS